MRPIEEASVVEYALRFRGGWAGDFGSSLTVWRRRPVNETISISDVMLKTDG
jgi:hypothetical protein